MLQGVFTETGEDRYPARRERRAGATVVALAFRRRAVPKPSRTTAP